MIEKIRAAFEGVDVVALEFAAGAVGRIRGPILARDALTECLGLWHADPFAAYLLAETTAVVGGTRLHSAVHGHLQARALDSLGVEVSPSELWVGPNDEIAQRRGHELWVTLPGATTAVVYRRRVLV